MKKYKFVQQNDALSGVIEALLLVALIAIVLSIIQIRYIPEIMTEREIDHISQVESQFSYLKSTIDIQSMTQEDVLVSSVVTLGSKELPFFVSAGSSGYVEIMDGNKTDSILKINLTGEDDVIFDLTSIKYQANNFYHDDQKFIMEGGGIIAEHPSESMNVLPPINKKLQGNVLYFNYTLPILKGKAEKKVSASSDENIFIFTNFSHSDPTITEDIFMGSQEKVEIHSDYLDAWNQSLHSLFHEEIENDYLEIKKYPLASPEYVVIKPDSGINYVRINLKPIHIMAQIGPGISE